MSEDMVLKATTCKQISAEENPWYWIYRHGVNIWNQWAMNNLNYSLKDEISEEIKEHCPNFEKIPNKSQKIDFSNTIFSDKEINFRDFIFPSEVTFKNSRFNQNSTFVLARFEGECSFQNCEFLGAVNFTESHFKKACFFIHAAFSEGADFKNAKFSGMAIFENTKFLNQEKETGVPLTMTSVSFQESLNFGNSKFSQTPDFCGSNIAGDFKLPHENILSLPPHKWDREKWAKLKLEMNRLHHYWEENNYFAKELECRALDTDKGKKLLINLYKKISDYGRSIAMPILLLILTTCICIFLYQLMLLGNEEITTKAYLMSLQSAFPFIPTDKALLENIDAYEGLSRLKIISLQTMRVLQTILSTILLFLIGLGIRNRLRIK